MGKEKVQFTLIFYLKQNKEVQLNLQRFEIFIFSSLLPSLPPGKIIEEKLTDRFSQFGICVLKIKPNQHLVGKYDTNQKQKGLANFWQKRVQTIHISHPVLTTAREIPKNKEKNPDKMCQKIYPQ